MPARNECVRSLLLASILVGCSPLAPSQITPTKAMLPEPVLQAGHRRAIHAVVFSPDGRWLASGAKDSTIKIWDVTTGRVLRTLYGHGSPVNALAVSPDGRLLASGSGNTYDIRYAKLFFQGGQVGGASEDTSVRIWDVATGRELHALNGHFLAVLALAFSRDGRTLMSASSDAVNIWQVNSGAAPATMKMFKPPKSSIARKMVFTNPKEEPKKRWEYMFKDQASEVLTNPEGELVALALPGKKFHLYDSARRRKIRELEVAARPETQAPLALSRDGRLVAFVKDGKSLVLQSATEKKDLWRSSLAALDYKVSLTFTPDGKSIAAELTNGQNRELRIFDTANGKVTRKSPVQDLRVSRVLAYSPDGKLLASVPRGSHFIYLRDASTGQLVRELYTSPGSNGKTTPEITQPDPELRKRLLAMGFSEPGELSEAEEDVGDFSSTYRADDAITFTRDGRWLLVKHGPIRQRTAVVWDTATGTPVQGFPVAQFEQIGNPDESPDGRFRATPQYEAETEGFKFSKKVKSVLGPGIDRGGMEAFEQRIRLFDARTGKKLHTLKAGDAPMELGIVPAAGFNLDGSRIAVTGYKGRRRHPCIDIFDTKSGKRLQQVDSPVTDVSGAASALAISANTKLLAVGYRTEIKVINLDTSAVLLTLPHAGGISALSFNADGRVLAALGKDRDAYLFDLNRGQLMATLVNINEAASGNTDWLVVTPDGLFDGSPSGWNQILWRFAGETFNTAPVETFFNEFYYPGLLSEILTGKPPLSPRNLAQLDRRQPTVQIVPMYSTDSVQGRTATVQIKIAAAPPDGNHTQSGGVRDVRLFRNGSLVKVWRGDLKLGADGQTKLEATVRLVAGRNQLTAYAFNNDNIKSSDAELLITGGDRLKRKGTAYVLVLGVNHYANSAFDLKFAVADAHGMSEELKGQLMKPGNWSAVTTVSLLDANATKANFILAMQKLAGESVSMSPEAASSLAQLEPAQPEDAVFIYFAGHGAVLGSRYYLIPHDLGYLGTLADLDETASRSIQAHSISDLELEAALEKVDAGEILLVIDACQSGQALETEEKRRGPMNSKGLSQLAYEKGMYVLAASQGYQAALEVEQLGHGLLTYALVEEGLKTSAADTAPKDGQVTAREWLDYGVLRVPQLQESQIEAAHKDGRELFFVDAERGAAIGPELRSLQRPRVFYRREPETLPFVITRLVRN